MVFYEVPPSAGGCVGVQRTAPLFHGVSVLNFVEVLRLLHHTPILGRVLVGDAVGAVPRSVFCVDAVPPDRK